MNEEQFLSKLTKEQKEATLKFDTDVAVSANAGSGKTTMLVQKYLYLQLFHSDKFNHKNIVAITFTKKASSEILFKIRNTISELLHPVDAKGNQTENELDNDQISILKNINRNLMNLEVGTIHKFCRKLLWDFGHRIELQSNFSVLEETERVLVYNKLIKEVLSEENSPIQSHIQVAILYLGYEETINLVRDLIFKKEHLSNQLNYFSKPYEQINDEILIKVKSMYRNIIFEMLDYLYFNSDNLDGVKSEKLEEFKELIVELKEIYDNAETGLPLIAEKLEQIRVVKSGSFISNTIFNNSDKKNFKSLIDNLFDYQEMHDDEISNTILPQRVKVGFALTTIAQSVSNLYDNLNKKNNRVDSDSTIDLALQLLDDPEILRIVQSDYKYLMIDEFQDTDQRQLKLANKMREGGKLKLFVVGDDKQSIYRFRNADVRVFKNLRNSLQSENRLELTTSFRSKLEINCFINDLFEPLMKEKRSEYDVQYKKIVSVGKELDKSHNRINLMLYHNPQKKIDEDVRVTPKEQFIKSLYYLLVKQDAKPSEICVLANSGSHLVELSKLISEKGLDFIILSGKGFFQKNEVKELIAFLRFIDNINNDLFLAATLKSAFFNYTDDDLYNICLGKSKSISFWSYFQEYVEKGKDERDIKTVSILKKFINLSNKLPLSNIIIKMIDDTNWNYYYNNHKQRESVYNNLYKFMGICRSLENRDFSNLSEQFELLTKRFIDNKDAEEIGDSSNAINLSTFHNAKGLEYKHIIIYNFDIYSKPSGMGRSIRFDEEYGLNVEIPASITNYKDFGTRKTIIDKYILDKYNIINFAESIRKYYVASTRAIDTLHIITSFSESGKQFNELEAIFGSISETKLIEKETEIDIYNMETKEIDIKKVQYNINIDLDKSDVEDYKFNLQKPVEIRTSPLKKYLEDIDTSEEEINFSSTKLNMFRNREYDKFKRTYVYGLPIINSDNLEYNEDNKFDSNLVYNSKARIEGKDFGLLFHYSIEIIEKVIDDYSNVDFSEIERLVKLKSDEFNITLDSFSLDNLIKTIKNVISSNFIKGNISKLISSEKEFELKMMFGVHTFNAIFDAFIIGENTAEIWDWKTNRFKEGDTIEAHASKNEFQMEFYALFAFRYKPNIENVITKLFYVRNATEAGEEKDWIYTRNYTRDDIPRIENNISEIIGGIKAIYPRTYPVSKLLG